MKSIITFQIAVPPFPVSHGLLVQLPFQILPIFHWNPPSSVLSPFLWRIRNAIPVGLPPLHEGREYIKRGSPTALLHEELLSERSFLEIQYNVNKQSMEEKVHRSAVSLRQTSWEFLVCEFEGE